MAETVEAFPLGKARGNKGSKYEAWLDGRIWCLTDGVDFTCSRASLRVRLATLCKLRGLRMTSRSTTDAFYIQAGPAEKEK